MRALAPLLLLASCATTARPAADPPPPALEELRGRVVLVDFFASWCVPCRDSMPFYAHLSAEQPELSILAVSVDEDAGALARFLDGVGPLPFPVTRDPRGELAARFGVERMPTCVILAPDGRVLFRHGGFDGSAIAAAVREALTASRGAP